MARLVGPLSRELDEMTAALTLVTAATVLLVASVSASAGPATRARRACHVPRLAGLTLSFARGRASRAGCTLRVKGAALEQAQIQTVERQSPVAGGHSSSVTVWLNPLCRGEAAYGPGLEEPVVARGPTKLVSGFYLVGGPSVPFSDPGCKRSVLPPGAGTVEVTNASGAIVATQTSARGHLVEITLPAGSYTITGTFLNATVNGVHPKEPESVVIPPGDTVRQDFFLAIP
jgi:hypothetical protein